MRPFIKVLVISNSKGSTSKGSNSKGSNSKGTLILL